MPIVTNPGEEALVHHLTTGHFVGGGTAYGERAECFDCGIVWTKALDENDENIDISATTTGAEE